jgi:type I restriction enzyme R subunit
MPIFRMLRQEIFGDTASEISLHTAEEPPIYGMPEEERISKLVALTEHLSIEVERELNLTGFWESIPARNKLVADLQKVLFQPDFADLPGLRTNRKHIISRLMEIAEKNNDAILHAA